MVALDARSGKPLWDVTVADANAGYSITMAPLIVKDKVLVGVSGGEFGIRGFIAAYDAANGQEQWRFHTIPRRGREGSGRAGRTDSWRQAAVRSGSPAPMTRN